MRLFLQLVTLGAALAVVWIAFAHRIRVPIGGFTTDNIAAPLVSCS